MSIASSQPGYEPQNTLEVPTPKEVEETASEAPSAKPGKKISSATKKRLQAKEATPQKKSEAKPKAKQKSIFNRKANPAFFNNDEEKADDDDVQILLNDSNVQLPKAERPKDPQESVMKEDSDEKVREKSVKEDPSPQKPKKPA